MWEYYLKPIYYIISTDVSLAVYTKSICGDFTIHSVITLSLTKLKNTTAILQLWHSANTKQMKKSSIFTNVYDAFVRLKCFQCIYSLYNRWFLYGVSYQISFKTTIVTLLKRKTEQMLFYKNIIAQVLKFFYSFLNIRYVVVFCHWVLLEITCHSCDQIHKKCCVLCRSSAF